MLFLLEIYFICLKCFDMRHEIPIGIKFLNSIFMLKFLPLDMKVQMAISKKVVPPLPSSFKRLITF